VGDPLKRVAVDTCVIIAAIIEPHSPRQAPSRWVLDQHRRTHTVVLPAIVTPEVLGAPNVRCDDGGRRARWQRITTARDWIEKRRYIVVSIDQRVSRRAEEFAPEYNLSGSDACVLAAAVLAQCPVLYTWDNGLLKVRNQVEGLEVREPEIFEPKPGTLDFS
jgi:predicted nucleic acid-binding protein